MKLVSWNLRGSCRNRSTPIVPKQAEVLFAEAPDLVAAAAETRDLAVLHYDADFDRIAAVTGQVCEWVVPAGSVD